MNRKFQIVNWLAIYVMAIFAVIPLLSAPSLIDGISYFKLIFALSTTPAIYGMLFLLRRKVSDITLNMTVILLVLLHLAVVIFIKIDYRTVFGAPGRNNGLLNLIMLLNSLIFGVIIFHTEKTFLLLKSLAISSSLVSVFALFHTINENYSLFSSLDFHDTLYHENVNNLAPLLALGVISSFVLANNSKRRIYLLPQIPTVVLIIKWSLLQSYFGILAGILTIILLKQSNRKILLYLFPPLTFLIYIFTLVVFNLEMVSLTSSIKERLEILNYASTLDSNYSALPLNIDKVSDFTSNFQVDRAEQFLDDFHNIFVQFEFTYGIIIGSALILLLVSPFYRRNDFDSRSDLVMPVYVCFFVGLLFAISSPNFMYFGFTLLGCLLANSFSEEVGRFLNVYLVRTLSILTLIVMVIISIDGIQRYEISHLTSRFPYSQERAVLSNDIYQKTLQLEDAGFRFLVAKNFYTIGKCDFLRGIIEQMNLTNPHEIRILTLRKLSLSCKNILN